MSTPCGIDHPRNNTWEGGIYLFKHRKGVRFPDFKGEGIVLDAKYKGYDGKEVQSIDRNDIHQVITYMYITKSHTGVILFPMKDDDVPCDKKELEGYGGSMQMLGLPVSSNLNYDSFKREMQDRELHYRETITSIINQKTTYGLTQN